MDDILFSIFQYLDYFNMPQVERVSKIWWNAGERPLLWVQFAQRVWSDKSYVPVKARQLLESGKPKEALKFSFLDAKRTFVTPEELFSFSWCFRFKASAGRSWTDLDPWWANKEPSQLKFLPNGNVVRVNHPGLYAGHDSSVTRKWRFVKSAAGRKGPKGSFIQVNEYPAYVVSRSKCWGFVMQSCWVIFTSFMLKPRKRQGPITEQEEREEEYQEITFKEQWTEATSYNYGIGARLMAIDDDGEQEEEDDGTEIQEDPVLQNIFSLVQQLGGNANVNEALQILLNYAENGGPTLDDSYDSMSEESESDEEMLLD